MVRPILLWLCFVLPILQLRSQNLHTPQEILEICLESKLEYELKEIKAKGPALIKGQNNDHFVYQTFGEKGIRLESYELTPYQEEAFKMAELLFAKGRYDEARKKYELVLKANPEFAVAMTFIGQTYGLENNLVLAIKWYRKAILVNNLDFKAHWFLAKTFYEMDRVDEAIPAIATAHVLNRNHREIKEDLQVIFKAGGLNYKDWEFRPAYGLEKTADGVDVKHAPGWAFYSLVKALWTFEPSYREEMVPGMGATEFNLIEEKEALLNMLMEHVNAKGKVKSKLAAVRFLNAAVTREMLTDFIFYEIWLPLEPLVAYTQPPKGLDRIVDYVIKVRGAKKL